VRIWVVRFRVKLCNKYCAVEEKLPEDGGDFSIGGPFMRKSLGMRKSLAVAVIGALAAGTMVGGATIALAQADPIKERQENRKQAGAAMRAIKGIIDAKGNAKDAVEQAAKLKTLEVALVKLFPAGSDKGDTKALPTVWTDWAGFEAANKNAEAAIDKLAAAAGSGDMAALQAAFTDTGKACGACHEKFRAKAN
jgi:cytochrome c556